MTSVHDRHRNNVRAGAFVSICLVLAFVVVITLGEFWRVFESTRTYTVAFPVQTGVGFLAEGADVRVGGVQLGRVTDITPHVQDDSIDTINVTMRLDQRVVLRPDAQVVLNSALIGKDAWLEIPETGTPDAGPPIGPDDLLAAAETPGVLTALLGVGQADRAAAILADVKQTTAFLADLDGEYDRRIAPMLDDMQTIVGEARDLSDRLAGRDIPRWAARIDHILERGEAGADEFEALMSDGRAIAGDVHNTVNRADGTMLEIDEFIRTARPSVEDTIEDLNAAGTDVRHVAEIIAREAEPTIERVRAFLQHGSDGAEAFAETIERLNVELDAELPGVREILANARLTLQQLKLTSIEVRRSPWKLLYRPSRSEFEHELLYESARSFALAVSDLKAASESVERVLDRHGDRIADDPETVERLREHLFDRFENYQQAQQSLLDVLFEEKSGGQ